MGQGAGRGRTTTAMTWIGRILVAIGVTLATLCLLSYALAAVDQARLSGKLRDLTGGARGDASGARPRAPVAWARTTRAEAMLDGLVGRIEIPRLGIDAMVIEGADDVALLRGVGHIPHTAFPGERGNAGLAAHRDTYFRALHDVAIGDRIRVHTLDGVFDYAVDRVRILGPDRDDVLDPTRRPRLTLVTCYPFHWIGPAPRRFVVDAHAIEASVASARSARHEYEEADPARGRPLAL